MSSSPSLDPILASIVKYIAIPGVHYCKTLSSQGFQNTSCDAVAAIVLVVAHSIIWLKYAAGICNQKLYQWYCLLL